jgi:6-pyruvoyl-tetrahydropterin synthase
MMAAKKEAKKGMDKEISKLYSDFEKEKRKINEAIARFDHKEINSSNKNFYQTFFGIASIVIAVGIAAFMLTKGYEASITGAAFTGINFSAASLAKNVYFNMVLGGIFGLLLVLLLHLIYKRK